MKTCQSFYSLLQIGIGIRPSVPPGISGKDRYRLGHRPVESSIGSMYSQATITGKRHTVSTRVVPVWSDSLKRSLREAQDWSLVGSVERYSASTAPVMSQLTQEVQRIQAKIKKNRICHDTTKIPIKSSPRGTYNYMTAKYRKNTVKPKKSYSSWYDKNTN